MESKQLIEYVWLGGSGQDFRSKCRVLKTPVRSIEDIPVWNYDGSSTGQADTQTSEVEIRPAKMIPDPFRGGHHKIVLCETYHLDGRPTASNFRFYAKKILEESACVRENIWFGIEQEYILCKEEGPEFKIVPVAWTEGKIRKPQGIFYCGVGAGRAIYREIPELHLKACMHAGLEMSGINAEVFPGQWEYQVGICEGLDVCDQLWLSRYLLYRVCEDFEILPVFDPKPFKGEWNGSGCHTNISTKSTRDASDKVKSIEEMLIKAKPHHTTLISLMGENNDERMTGMHETSSIDAFTWSVGGRHTSIRLPSTTANNDTGYFEDRRPAANMDAYLVCAALADALLLDGKHMAILDNACKHAKMCKAKFE